MDVRLIIKEMIKNGQSRQEILSNLQELGIDGPEKYYDDALRSEGMGTISSKLDGGSGGSIKEIVPPADEAEADREAKDILENETKPLFGEQHAGGLFAPKPSGEERKRAEKAVEEIPKLEITSIGDEGEKVSSIDEMIGGEEKPPEVMKKMPSSNFQDLDDVERKLDDTISLLKAIYDIDRKILEVNRDVLLRLKGGKV